MASYPTLGGRRFARSGGWGAMGLRGAAELGRRRLWAEDLNPGQIIAGARIATPIA
ncbi:MAG: hypothetical protein LBD77_03260 [Bifidobacteriaceae bacterium]|nr:hypothetical protein [Bifidobacteriaceae bacterium]